MRDSQLQAQDQGKRFQTEISTYLLLFSFILAQSHRLGWSKSASCHASTTCKPYSNEANVADKIKE